MIAGPPDVDLIVPAAVVAVAAGEPLKPVWINQVGGLTFAVGVPPGHHFLKWNPRTSGIDLSQEISRLEWAAPITPVPVLIDRGAAEDGEWFTSRALPGENAVSERWKADPATAVAAIGRGLRRLHDTLPAEHCPFSWSVDDRLAKIEERAALDLIDPATWHADHQALNLGQALGLLTETSEVDQLVVCHGDACAPNTLLHDNGTWSGHVDLGSLGIADRWADIAVATWSSEWNYGPGWEEILLDAYGIDPDPVRTAYYRLLWDLG